MDKKIILLITYDNWGFNQYIADALETKNYDVKHINFHSFRYKYPSFYHKALNFFTKNLGLSNLKHIHYNEVILDQIESIQSIDASIYIKADFLSKETIEAVNKKSRQSVLIISDSINRYPKTKNILSLFDKVFSFEKKDCKKYNLRFKTNFIYKTTENAPENYKYKVFNISSFDNRFPVIKKIAKAIYEMKIKSKIVIFTSKENTEPYLEFSKKSLSIEENNQFLEESEIMLDVSRNGQEGLSFRVFESLGLKKKLITTNKDIVNYDFYNPDNIFVIENADDIKIPQAFFETSHVDIPENILNKYLIENWVDELVE
ncbi:MAG: lipopolysaccharide core biosynthesis protein rfaS [Chryseobacterium sp.]|nr:MAG: lipopolysaccharide core biosynthesis protein rfaS [Chryseobacterium sp.]